MKAVVRQKRGPGMNKGLKKPRKNTFPKGEPYKPFRVTEPKGSGKAGKAASGSYLPDFAMGSTGKQRKRSK